MADGIHSWEDSARDIMAEWNLEDDEDRSRSLLPPYPPGFPERLDADAPSPAGDALDSFPAGSTALCGAFVLGPDSGGEGAEPGGDQAPEGDFLAEDEPRQEQRSGRPKTGSRPQPGDEIRGFRLVMELGRGAFARVYLAEEINLGNRPVALKVSRAEGEEPRLLARLQHAHIVPVHSVQDDPATGLRLLCMPFLGGANLSLLLHETGGGDSPRASGRTLVEALEQLSKHLPAGVGQETTMGFARSRRSRSASVEARPKNSESPRWETERPADPPAPAQPSIWRFRSLVDRWVAPRLPARVRWDELDAGLPSRQFLRGANVIEAAVWIVARLAEGLDHAHSRGLLHRDLKPANILIAADGTPMLLDFNLAAETEPELAGGEAMSRAVLGGTLPYMAPEHLDAFDPQGSTSPEAVDERSDLYSLGLILFEMIAGRHPFPEPPSGLVPLQTVRTMVQERRLRPVPSLRAICNEVPWSLDALVSKCLNPDPQRRYASAGDLAEDLRRFLDDLPMRHCPEPSPRERAAKWARRHPTITSSGAIASACVLLLGLLLIILSYINHEEELDLITRTCRREFDRDFVETKFLLNVTGQNGELLKRGVRQARMVLEGAGIGEVPVAHDPARRVIEPRRTRLAWWIDRLPAEERRLVRRQLVDLMVLEAQAGVLLLDRRASEEDRRRALIRAISRLDQAERLDAPLPSTLFSERARYLAALGDAEAVARDRARAAETVPTSSQDLTLLGTSLLTAGDLAGAEAALEKAIARDQTSLWAWFAMGHCHFEQGRYDEAAGDFTACVALGFSHALTHFNRGLALARAGHPREARLAYDRAIELDPELIEARVDRALVELELGRREAALPDLLWAVDHGCRTIGVLAALGETQARLGRSSDAEKTFAELLAEHPADPIVLVARGMSRLDHDPEAARRDFESALEQDRKCAIAHYGMAHILRRHDHREALAELDLALQLDPNLVDALHLRALERARLGDRGALDDAESLVKSPTMHRLYNAACAHAVFARVSRDPRPLDRSVQLLERALRAGFPVEETIKDPDLNPLRDRPDYKKLIARFRGSPPRTSGR
jgi:serine/threonine protein kinase/tetratricopeptide (TPR) repeat protein